MSKFLTTPGVVAEVDRIVRNAKESLTFISPFVYPSSGLLERLSEAERRGIQATLVIGKRMMNPPEEERLNDLKRLRILYCPNLHAKCYANENMLVITSLNLMQSSERKNREMGVLLERSQDASAFEEAQREVRSIVESSKPYQQVFDALAQKAIEEFEALEAGNGGHCIRCHEEIPLDRMKPLCPRCYAKYAQWNNPSYPECFCHGCGQEYNTTFAKPLCPECYKTAVQWRKWEAE